MPCRLCVLLRGEVVKLDPLYAVWDMDCDDPGIIGLFETKEEADAHAKYATHKYGRAMTVVEYQAKANENK